MFDWTNPSGVGNRASSATLRKAANDSIYNYMGDVTGANQQLTNVVNGATNTYNNQMNGAINANQDAANKYTGENAYKSGLQLGQQGATQAGAQAGAQAQGAARSAGMTKAAAAFLNSSAATNGYLAGLDAQQGQAMNSYNNAMNAANNILNARAGQYGNMYNTTANTANNVASNTINAYGQNIANFQNQQTNNYQNQNFLAKAFTGWHNVNSDRDLKVAWNVDDWKKCCDKIDMKNRKYSDLIIV